MYAGGRTANVVEDDTTDTLGYRTAHSVVEAFAFVRIPENVRESLEFLRSFKNFN